MSKRTSARLDPLNFMVIPDAIQKIQKVAAGKPLRAFHGSAALKKFYLQRVTAHRQADQLVHGTYWDSGKGCAVGCSIHGGDHSRYETELGIPQALAELEDGIFEGLDNGDALQWPTDFLQAIPVGADLSVIWPKFAHWLLVDEKCGVIRHATNEAVKKSINSVAALYARWISGDKPSEKEWRAAAAAAAAAWRAAAASADTAAAWRDADAAAAAAAAWRDADAAADTAAAWRDADAAAAARKNQSVKLIELLKDT